MPRGGWRGGGRPLGSKDKKPRVRKAKPAPKPVLDAAAPLDEEPMAYMRRIMNDPTAEVGRRDRMAVQLAALQVRLGEMPPIGKRARAQIAGEAVATGEWKDADDPDGWGDDLVVRMPPRRPRTVIN